MQRRGVSRPKGGAATTNDLGVAQDLLDTLVAHKDGGVGMAANMIGVNKRIIAFDNEGEYMVMSIRRSSKNRPLRCRRGLPLPYRDPPGQALEVHQGALAEREVSRAAENVHRLDAQIIQHEIDHCEGKII